tara:strand:- start:117 stop:245 length:129 start_codon:yes stop_codon:yes gene_type:complete
MVKAKTVIDGITWVVSYEWGNLVEGIKTSSDGSTQKIARPNY